VVPLIRDRVAVGTLAAGRSPDRPGGAGAVTVVDRDGAGRRRARTEVARYLAVVAIWTGRPNLPDGLCDRLRDLSRPDGTGGRRADPDDVLDRFAFSGTLRTWPDWAGAVAGRGAGPNRLRPPHGLTDAEGVPLGRRSCRATLILPGYLAGWTSWSTT